MAVGINSGDILTAEQLSNHIKVYAGPGAGKTYFLVENVKSILAKNPRITNSHFRKVSCITYTNAAVDVMRQRLGRLASQVDINTIHGFIIEHIIKPFQQDLREIINEEFKIAISVKGNITSQIEGLGILHGEDKEQIFRFITDTTGEATKLNYSKKLMGDVEVDIDVFSEKGDIILKASKSIAANHILPIKEYIWSRVKKLTHDEILYFGYKILKRNSTALYAIRVKFPFIFIDEFQDTSPLQTALMQLIGEKSTIIGIIGDIAQSIYSFQGARPSKFSGFTIGGDRVIDEYEIAGNRRSTANIINFCNFFRQTDTLQQVSKKPYKSEAEKGVAEAKKVHFILGNGANAITTIRGAISAGGAVLTRTWSAAFEYIDGISDEQHGLFKKIYNSYYNSPIDIRLDITEQNNVTWVRAFRFIFMLWEGHKSGSFVDVLKAHRLYIKEIKAEKLRPHVIMQIKSLADMLFSDLSDVTKTTDIINKFNTLIKAGEYTNYRSDVLGENFIVNIFDELDRDDLKSSIVQLNWETSYKLFTEVFSAKSHYMTVHQAKGLEWMKVIVSVMPSSRNDKTTLNQMYSNPQILKETPEEEFTRIYYVACSRAIEDLYIHFADGFDRKFLIGKLTAFIEKSGQDIQYEFIE